VSRPDAPVEQPAVYRLMVELGRCREELAPQLPQYARHPPSVLAVGDDPAELYDMMRVLSNEVHTAYVQEYGAPSAWQQPGREQDAHTLLLHPQLQVFDTEPEDWESRSALEYDDGPLRAASRAYKRETGWDHAPTAPSPDYAWVCIHQPHMCWYDEDACELRFSGNLVGFAIVADRDDDEKPETLAHLWVARQARRSGHATLLLAEAERRFPALKSVEHPVTADGTAFLLARSPRLSAGLAPRRTRAQTGGDASTPDGGA
jgi:ribosomal protein S18 acetylase RimI-like enzyme